jgi:hypothetical protein
MFPGISIYYAINGNLSSGTDFQGLKFRIDEPIHDDHI